MGRSCPACHPVLKRAGTGLARFGGCLRGGVPLAHKLAHLVFGGVTLEHKAGDLADEANGKGGVGTHHLYVEEFVGGKGHVSGSPQAAQEAAGGVLGGW